MMKVLVLREPYCCPAVRAASINSHSNVQVMPVWRLLTCTIVTATVTVTCSGCSC